MDQYSYPSNDSLSKVAAMMWGELQKLPPGAKLTLTAHTDTNPNNPGGTLFIFTASGDSASCSFSATLSELSEEVGMGINTNARFRAAVNDFNRKIGWV